MLITKISKSEEFNILKANTLILYNSYMAGLIEKTSLFVRPVLIVEMNRQSSEILAIRFDEFMKDENIFLKYLKKGDL